MRQGAVLGKRLDMCFELGRRGGSACFGFGRNRFEIRQPCRQAFFLGARGLELTLGLVGSTRAGGSGAQVCDLFLTHLEVPRHLIRLGHLRLEALDALPQA